MSATRPGDALARTLKALGLSQAELARRTGLTTKHVNRIIKADVPISPAVAVAIGEATGVPAEVWMVLEAVHRVQSMTTTRAGAEQRDGAGTTNLQEA